MRVVTNEALIAKRKKQASIITPIAMLLLVGGLVTNFMSTRNPETSGNYVIATIVLLALGFLAATISSSLVNHWVREPRPDQVIAKTMRGFDSKHYLFNHTTVIPHVLLTPTTVYAVTPKIQDGEITVDDRKWKRKFQLGRLLRFFGEEGLGNPTVEAEHNYTKVAQLVQDNLPNSDAIRIEPLILFTHPEVQLTVNNSPIPVVTGNKLKRFIRQATKGSGINAEDRRALVELFKSGLDEVEEEAES